VTRTVLARLGQRLAGGEAKDLAAQLPVELQDVCWTSRQPGRQMRAVFMSALTVRLVLAVFGLVVCGGGAVVLAT
jgi:hypothetical protein